MSDRYDGPWPVDAFRVRPLREGVLRPNQPPEASVYPGDDDPLAVHLATFAEGEVVAVGSLFPSECGEAEGSGSSWRIRGMATLPEHRDRGLGSRVLEGLLAAAAARGGGRVWCNGRTGVLGFYERHGFRVEGEEFEIEGIGPHLRMATEVASAVRPRGFDLHEAKLLLERTPRVLRSWVGGLPDSIVETPEAPGLWSIRNLVGHLVFGEMGDWIVRAEHILSPDWETPFRPFERFAMYRLFHGRSLESLLDEFSERRREGLERLDALDLDEEKLDSEGRHPTFGPVTLRQLLAAWVAHDLSHLAQAGRIMAQKVAPDVGPWSAFIRAVREGES